MYGLIIEGIADAIRNKYGEDKWEEVGLVTITSALAASSQKSNFCYVTYLIFYVTYLIFLSKAGARERRMVRWTYNTVRWTYNTVRWTYNTVRWMYNTVR